MFELIMIDTKTGKPFLGTHHLGKWLEEKILTRGWEDWEISEERYFVSFIPLFQKKFFDKKKGAEGLGIAYGTLRNFLSERKVKRATDDHLKEFASLFCDQMRKELAADIMYLDRASKNAKKTTKSYLAKKFSALMEEASLYYSKTLIEVILSELWEGFDRGYNTMFFDISYNRLLDILIERFEESNDNVNYLRFSLEQLRGSLGVRKVILDGFRSGKKIDRRIIDELIKSMTSDQNRIIKMRSKIK